MELSVDQLQAAAQGQAVAIEVNGKSFVLLSRAAYEDDFDFSPWTKEEIDLLADEAAVIVAGDGLDEDD